MPRRGLPSDGAGEVVDAIQKDRRRIDTLEKPDGSQLGRALEKVQQLILDLPGMVTAAIASLGSLSIAGTMSAGAVSTTGDIATSGGYVFTPAGYAYNITYSRVGAWLGNDGRLGYASSSRKTKTNIVASDVDPEAILKVCSVLFDYRAEVAKRDDPESPEYVGPDYVVHREFGAIAEDLHDLGLGVVVDYDENGEPRGIIYPMVGLLAIEAAKHLSGRIDRLEARLNALDGQ